MITGYVPDPRHTHQWGDWEPDPALDFLRLRHCRYEDCNVVEFGLVDKKGNLLRTVTARQLESYQQEVEDVRHRHDIDIAIARNTYQHTLERLRQELKRDLLKAQIRLMGGIP